MIAESDALAALPQRDCFLRDFVLYASQCTDANSAFHILGGLVCLAQTLPTTAGIPQGGLPLRGNIFTLAIGPSTVARKTVSISIGQGLLEAAGYKGIAEAPGSAEGLLETIRKASGRVVLVYGEFGSFLAQTERGYAVPIKTLLTEAYDSRSLGRALAKQQRGAIENPRVSVYAGSTLDFMERHTEPVDWTGGFLGRFLTFHAKNERDWPMQPPDPPGRKALIKRLSVFSDLDEIGMINECLGYSPSARRLWDSWYYDCQKRASSSVRETRAAIARAFGMAHKICLLLAWDFGDARQGQPWYVTEEHLIYAIKIIELHIQSVLEIGDSLAPSKDLRDRIAILQIVGDTPMTLGQIITKSKVGLKRRVQDLLGTLEEENMLKRVLGADGHTDFYLRTVKNGANGATGVNGWEAAEPPPILVQGTDLEAEGEAPAAPVDLE